MLPIVLDTWIQSGGGDGRCHVGAEGSQAFGMTVASFQLELAPTPFGGAATVIPGIVNPPPNR